MGSIFNSKPIWIKAVLSLTFVLLLAPAASFSYSAKVIKVSDGDTITVLNNGKQEKIRLYGVDCPEKKQAFGQSAKRFTLEFAGGQRVEVRRTGSDRYGRTIGWVSKEGKNLNEELIKNGFAWHYKQYSSDRNLARAEVSARNARMGLWREADPTPPWEYRRAVRATRSAKPRSGKKLVTGAGYSGNVKSRKFHGAGCRHYTCSNCIKRFTSRKAALGAGYSPCGVCKP